MIGRIGAVVEQPKFMPTFTGRKNLRLLAGSIGVPDRDVDAAIERVGLAGRDRERCDQSYVLGLGHGAAYLGVLLGIVLVLSLLLFRRRDIP